MHATNWTRPEAYGVPDGSELHAAVADGGARHMLRAFERMAGPLDRAASRTRSAAVRSEIEAAACAMTSAFAVQEVLRRTLMANRPVLLAEVLGDLCSAMRTGPGAGSPPALEIRGDVASTCTSPSIAWGIAASVVEMAELAGRRCPVRVCAEFLDGHLAVVAARDKRAGVARLTPGSARGAGAAHRTSVAFLGRLAALLHGRIVHEIGHGRRGLALVIKVSLLDDPPGAPP